jgi:hypothetical protein
MAAQAESSIEMVLNLTNPSSHYEITKRCLDAGKHVYSEKPLAMDGSRGRPHPRVMLAGLSVQFLLQELASWSIWRTRKAVCLAAAPCKTASCKSALVQCSGRSTSFVRNGADRKPSRVNARHLHLKLLECHLWRRSARTGSSRQR